jgi:hypothetical protein
MRNRLLDEGVPFKSEYEVDLDQCLWLPWEEEPSPAPDEMDDLDPIAG